jgi:MFS family permease
VLGFVSLFTDLSSEIYHALLPAFVTVALALPVAALGAIDGISEATASFAKLASGRLSDRSRARKPWVLLGYGMAALAKPLFAIATTGGLVLLARFADRLGKGIRGAPRDAIIADETPPSIRGRAFGLRQALDTVGAVLAPLAAVGLMYAFAGDIRTVFWIAAIPAALAFAVLLFGLKEHRREHAGGPRQPFFAGFRDLARPTRRVLAIGFLFMLARFSESFLVLRGMDLGLSPALSPLVMVVFSFGYLALAYPMGALSDRMKPQTILVGGMVGLIAGNLILANELGMAGLVAGVLLWGVHMAMTQGIFARMVADSAPEHLRATSFGAFHFVTGIATLLASVGAGLLWDRDGASATFMASAGIAAVALAMLTLLPEEHSPPLKGRG